MFVKPIRFTLFDILVIAIVCTSLISVFSFAIGCFSPKLSFLSGAFLGIVCLSKISFDFINVNKSCIVLLGAILLLALGIRLFPFMYIMGGQDQGLYVNMSAYYQREGTPFIKDSLRASLSSQDVKKIYDENNLLGMSANRKIKGVHEGAFLPGVYVKDWEKSEYVFQFYHLHPLWMAIFADAFGDKARIGSLTFFSLISIVAFYLLAMELSGNRLVANGIALLLALNPLHVFFSKFPVSEIPALAFSTIGFYYFVRMWRELNIVKQESFSCFLIPLVLSLSSFLCFFLTRISGFMYMPFFFVLWLASFIYLEDPLYKRVLSCYFGGVILLYCISIGYGLYTSFPYSRDIYSLIVNQVNSRYGIHILVMILFISIWLMIIAIKPKTFVKTSKYLNFILSFAIKNLHLLLYGLIGIALFKLYLLGFSDKFALDRLIGQRWGLANSGFESVRHGSIVVAMKYISPLLAFIFFAGLSKLKKTFYGRVILFFLVPFWAYIGLFQWVIYYEFYYARYLLTEIVPYTILASLMIIGLSQKGLFKLGLIVVLIMTTGYFSYATFHQIGYDVSKNQKETILDIASAVSDSDLLLFLPDSHAFTNVVISQIEAPLRFFSKKNVFKFVNWLEFERIINSRDISKYSNVYLLSGKRFDADFLEKMKTINYETLSYSKKLTKLGWNPFFRPVVDITFFMYRIELKNRHKSFLHAEINRHSNNGLIREGFYSDNIWTNGDGIISGLSIDLPEAAVLTLKRVGWHPYGEDLHKTGVNVYVNGTKLALSGIHHKMLNFKISQDIKRIEKIRISSKTFVPADIGINNDKRKLGVDVDRIIIWSEPK